MAEEKLQFFSDSSRSDSIANFGPLLPNDVGVDWRRWVVLTLFSFTSFSSMLICFTYAPIASYAEDHYDNSHSAFFVSIFFLCNVVVMLRTTWVIQKRGIRFAILLGAWLQATGATVRALYDIFGGSNDKTKFGLAIFGQFLAAIAQGFFVTPPPALAALWFPTKERTMATSVAVNANTLGIAGAYLLVPLLVHGPDDIPRVLIVIASICIVLAILCQFFFFAEPRMPPSVSALKRKQSLAIKKSQAEQRSKVEQQQKSKSLSPTSINGSLSSNNMNGLVPDDDITQMTLLQRLKKLAELFKDKGFVHCVIAFGIAESAINSFSSFMNDMLDPEGFSLTFIAAMGVVFIIACMIGSSIAAKIIDEHHNYRMMMLLCFLGAAGGLVWFSMMADKNIIGTSTPNQFLIIINIILIGGFVGPLQPIAIETGAEVTFREGEDTEAALTAVMQLAGNLFSSILVPVLSAMRDSSAANPMEVPNWILAVLVGGSGLVFLSFNGEYKRLLLDMGVEEEYEDGRKVATHRVN